MYKDPYIFHDEQSEYARDENLTRRFCLAIETTVKELIPVQQILQTYMSQESRDIDLDGDIEDTIDPDVIDDTLDEMEEPMEEPVETGEVQEGEPMPMEGEQSEPVEQFDSIMNLRLSTGFRHQLSLSLSLNHNLRGSQWRTMFYLVTHQSSVQKNLPIIKWSPCQNISATRSVQP